MPNAIFPPKTALVIGAGPIGLCVALALSDAGLSVSLVHNPSVGTGPRAGGMMAPSLEWANEAASGKFDDDGLARLAGYLVGGFEGWNKLAGQFDLSRTGPLHWLETEPGVRRDDLMAAAEKVGQRPTEFTDSNGRYGLIFQDEWALDPKTANAGLMAALTARGVAIFADKIEAVGAGFAQGAQKYQADIICVATGYFGKDLMAVSKAILPVKGMLMRLGGTLSADLIRFASAYQGRNFGLYAIKRGQSTILGASAEIGRDDLMPDGALLVAMRGAAGAVLPEILQMPIVESWAGIRPLSENGLPIIGKDAATGVIFANGGYRHGWLMAPKIAQEVLALAKAG